MTLSKDIYKNKAAFTPPPIHRIGRGTLPTLIEIYLVLLLAQFIILPITTTFGYWLVCHSKKLSVREYFSFRLPSDLPSDSKASPFLFVMGLTGMKLVCFTMCFYMSTFTSGMPQEMAAIFIFGFAFCALGLYLFIDLVAMNDLFSINQKES